MSFTTKRYLTERIRRIIAGGFPSDMDRVRDAEIMLATGSVCATLLKAQVFDISFNFDGGAVVDGAVLVKYEDRPVVRGNGNTSTIELPTMPMYLPERMGVFAVYPSGYPQLQFTPIPPGLIYLFLGNPLISTLSDMLYTFDNKNITVYADLVGAGITKCDLELCVVDMAKLGDNDPLPISTDQEAQVIQMVLQMYGYEGKERREEDSQPASNK